jgi:UDP-glucose 4-epimerase
LNVLVVGGAGYIGSATCRVLLGAGHTVTVFDNLVKGHRGALTGEAELVIGDTGDPADLDRVFSSRAVDVVMDFAAFIEAGESMDLPARYFRNNTASALTLVEAMLRHDVGRLVFSSSAAVFGDPESVPVAEDAPRQPTNPYGESKLQVERMLSWISSAHGLRFAALRYFNAAGAVSPDCGEDHDPESHLIPLVLGVALGRREAVRIYGTDYPTPDGTCVRDYVHVADLASAHLLALEALSTRQSVLYNLGNGTGFSVREIVDSARRVTGRDLPCVECPRRPGDPAALVASPAAIRADLGWSPRHGDLDSIVSSAWEWHVKHPDGYGD